MKGEVDQQWLAARLAERPKTPAGEEGGVRVRIETIPPGQQIPVVSLRNAIFMGDRPTSVTFHEPFETRRLSYEGGEWMRDDPQEVWQMFHPLETVRDWSRAFDSPCRLLVGGLGLGVFSALAAGYGEAIVDTVERDDRVISLVGPHVDGGRIIRDDVYDYAAAVESGQYDVAFLDTWQSTGEYCWATEVVPLRRLLRRKVEAVLCWNEREMVGQINLGALRAMAFPAERIARTNTPMRILRRRAEALGLAVRSNTLDDFGEDKLAKLIDLESDRRQDPRWGDLVGRLTRDAGSEGWESEFGELWDEAEAERAEAQQEFENLERQRHGKAKA